MATGSRVISPRSSVWFSERPAPRRKAGQQPAGLDRAKIVTASVRLLDAEGLSKFSMRRLATELGVTAMSVYWYVDTKDDLLELALDRAMGEMSLPAGSAGPAKAEPAAGAEPDDWQDQLRQLAEEYRGLLVRHPWLARLTGEYLNVGPNSTAFSHAARRVMRSSGLSDRRLPGALSLVHQFVYGFSTIEGRFAAHCRQVGVSQDDYFHEVMGAIRDRPEFEESRELMEARSGETVQEMRDRDFSFALDCAIAGIEALRDGRRSC